MGVWARAGPIGRPSSDRTAERGADGTRPATADRLTGDCPALRCAVLPSAYRESG